MKKDITKVKKIFNGVITAFLALLFIFIAVVLCSVFVTIGSGKTPDVFGYQFYVVVSESMSPTLEVGDVLISKKVENLTEHSAYELKEGDIVTYVAPSHAKIPGMIITHRIVEGIHFDENYGYVVTTKGDRTGAVEDPPTPISSITAVGVKKSPFLTAVYGFFTKPIGLILLIAIPLVLLLGSMVYRLILLIKKPSAEFEKEKPLTEDEIAKKAVEDYKKREQYIAELKKKAIEDYKKENEK